MKRTNKDEMGLTIKFIKGIPEIVNIATLSNTYNNDQYLLIST